MENILGQKAIEREQNTLLLMYEESEYDWYEGTFSKSMANSLGIIDTDVGIVRMISDLMSYGLIKDTTTTVDDGTLHTVYVLTDKGEKLAKQIIARLEASDENS